MINTSTSTELLVPAISDNAKRAGVVATLTIWRSGGVVGAFDPNTNGSALLDHLFDEFGDADARAQAADRMRTEHVQGVLRLAGGVVPGQ